MCYSGFPCVKPAIWMLEVTEYLNNGKDPILSYYENQKSLEFEYNFAMCRQLGLTEWEPAVILKNYNFS